MSVFHNNILGGAAGQTTGGAAAFKIERSLRFNSGDSAYLNRTPSSAGNRKTWTWSGWVKRCADPSNHTALFTAGTTATDSGFFRITFHANGHINVATGATNILYDGGKLRDFSAWYHVLVSVDTTASSNQVKCYVNGALYQQATAISNVDTAINSTVAHQIGRDTSETTHADIYLADVHFIDGQALAATDFGEYDDNNVWQPKEYSGSHGPLVNQSQTWSDSLTTSGTFSVAATTAFDGVLTQYCRSTGPITFTPSSAITFTDKVEVYTAFQGTTTVNGSTGPALPNSAGFVTLASGGGSLTSFVLTNGNTDAFLGAVRVDGELLVDSGVTVSSNGFHLDFSDNSSNAALGTDSSGNSNTWTVNNLVAVVDEISASSSEISNPNNSVANYLNIFDGDTSTTVSSGNGGRVIWTPSSNISISKIEGYFDDSLNGYRITMSVSGGSSQTITIDTSSGGTANQWNEFTSLSGDTIGPSNAITFSMLRPAGNDTDPGLHDLNALRINDKLVVLNSSQAGVDSLIDTPTNYTADSGNNGGNYCVMNPLDMRSNVATQNGNMEVSNATAGWSGIRGTIGVSSGKWYYELQTETASIFAGIATAGVDIYANAPQDSTSVLDDGALIYCDDGKYLLDQGGSANRQTYGSALANGDILGVAFDLDGGTAQFYKNGTALGSINISSSPLASKTVFPYYISYYSSTTSYFNFGQRPFAYTPPTGFKSLCTTNLPDPTIADGSTAFDAKEYSGTSATQKISLNFGADFVWIKCKASGFSHQLFDIVRGANKTLHSNTTAAESTATNSLTSFDSDGFTLGSDTNGDVNGSGNFVAWAWDAGTSTVSNTDGSITSNVRANPSTGFSIVSYTGNGSAASVGHGLNATPAFYFIKNRSSVIRWTVYHSAIGKDVNVFLNETNALAFNSNVNGSSGPDSSVFYLKTSYNEYNTNNNNYIAYCFAPVEGYSAFGSYEGNGSSDGPFVYTGFRPAWVLYKNADAAAGWQIYDSTRDPFNQCDARLQANSNGAEDTEAAIDILSNGFKQRATHTRSNANGDTYIYAAFAEHPFKTARAR